MRVRIGHTLHSPCLLERTPTCARVEKSVRYGKDIHMALLSIINQNFCRVAWTHLGTLNSFMCGKYFRAEMQVHNKNLLMHFQKAPIGCPFYT